MRSIRNLTTTLLSIVAVAVSTLVAAPAAHATGTPLQYKTWNVTRSFDASGVVHVGAQSLSAVNIESVLKASFLTTLSAGDVVDLRWDVLQGRADWFEGTVSFTTNNISVSAAGQSGQSTFIVPSTATLANVTYSFQGSVHGSTSGIIQIVPKMYVNGTLSNLAVADIFSSNLQRVTAKFYTDTYTATAEDVAVKVSTSGCADLSSVSAGQTLTYVASPTLNSSASATNNPNIQWYSDGISHGPSVPNPKPSTFMMLAYTANFDTVTSGATYAMSTVLKSNGTDVTTDCLASYGTVTPTSTNLTITGLSAIADQFSNKFGYVSCVLTDRVTGTVIHNPMNVYGFAGATQSCGAFGVLVGRTYDVEINLAPTMNLDYAIARWNYVWTVGSFVYPTSPTLTGSNPTSARYEATNVDTAATVGGNSHVSSASGDGRAGRLGVNRIDATHLRITHWGPTGALPMGTTGHIDFLDPISDPSWQWSVMSRSTAPASVTWFGTDHDKWTYMNRYETGYVYVTGTQSSDSTQTGSVSLASVNAACATAIGPGAKIDAEQDSDFVFTPISAGTSNQLVKILCTPAVNAEANSIGLSMQVLASLNVSTGVLTGLTRLDSVGDVDPANPTYFAQPNYFFCAGLTSATNPKANLGASDPVIVFVAAHGSAIDNGVNCRAMISATGSFALDRLETIIVHADGSVTKKLDAQLNSGAMTAKYIGNSVAFDSLGNVNVLYTSTTTTMNALRNLDVFSLSLSGVNAGSLTLTKHLAQDVMTEFNQAGFQNNFFALANGGGDTEKLYAARYMFGASTVLSSSVINLSSGDITTGEPLSSANAGSWVSMAMWTVMQAGFEAEAAGGINYMFMPATNKYSVIHWVPGVDPSLGPVITSPNTATVTAGTTAVLTPTVSTTGNTWAITGGANSGLFNINASTGALTFKTAAVPGTYVVEISVTNNGHTTTQTITVTVPDTTPPTVTVNQTPTVASGSTTVVTPSANEHVTWSITGGANQNDFDIDPTTGAVTFKTAMPSGTYVVEITATDDNGNVTHKTITVTVGSDTTPPVVTINQTPTVQPGATAVTTGSANESVTWSITGGAQRTSFDIDPATGDLTFKAGAVAGTYVVIVTATDGSGNVTHKTVTVTVPAGPTAPTIELASTIDVAEWSGYNIPLDLTSDQDVTWEVTAAHDNSSFINSDGKLVIGSIGAYATGLTVTLKATNATTSLTTTKVITIRIIKLELVPAGTVNTSGQGSYTFTTTHAINAGNLSTMGSPTTTNPALTNLQWVNGVLTFDVDPNYTGTADIQFCVADYEGCVGYVTVTLHIGAVTAPTSASHHVIKNNKTKIQWTGGFNASYYIVKLGSKKICRTSATYCIYNGLIGGRKVKIIAYGANGSTASINAHSDLSQLGRVASIINFDVNSAKLTWRQKYRLNILIKALRNGSFTTLHIVGHTDNSGSVKIDPRLSLNRAKAVKAYILYFMPKLKISVEGVGRTQPAKKNTSSRNKAFNRRAEVYAG